MLQLVLPDELAVVANERKNKPDTRPGKGAKGKSKGSKAHPVKPLDIDPAKLHLTDETFCLPDGTPVPQLQLHQVGPLASGIALVSFADAQQFLQSGRILTRRGLALLILNGPDEMQTDLQWSSLRFAAKCSVNQQPVLLSGHLVQLGETMIGPYFSTSGSDVADVPVACARLTVFQDQLPKDWTAFAEHPFRHILAMLHPLQMCRIEQCHCDKWHPASDEAGEVLLDVFRRQFFTDGGKPCKAHQASHFSVQIRYLKTQELAVLKLSGTNGLYAEPRVTDATAPSDEYQVVWLPQSTFAQVQHLAQCEPYSVGLARTGRRFGIRVTAQNFQQLFQKLKPDGQFLAPGTKQNWLCGPWPYGSDRKSLAKIFAEWQWQARPLQPARPIQGGVMWLIQSVLDPPQAVWNMKHGQVVVSKCASANVSMLEHDHVVGPQATVELCSSTAAQDPWLVQDPWQQTLSKIQVPAAPNMVSQLQDIEDRLEKSLLAKLPCERMEVDDSDQRIHQLEQQVMALAGKQQNLEHTVNEHHRQNTAQVQSLQSQMMSQMETNRSQMAPMFEDQMSKLEAILAKKGRFE